MRPDPYQQTVIDCDTSAVVSAGAGSGKTTVLSRRFLRLIEQGKAGVGEILTLTFTRKAAAEMYERIYGILLENRDNPAVAAAVADFDKASISTLDSFCSRIARDCSSSFGIPPTFTTDEASVRALAEEVSLDYILENAANEHLREFIYINGFENVWKNFFVYISMDYLAIGAPVDFRELYEKQLAAAEAALLGAASAVDEYIAEILALEPVSKSIEKAQGEAAALPDCRELAESGDYSSLAAVFSSFKLKKPGGRTVKEEIVRYKEIADEANPLFPEIAGLAGTLGSRLLLEGLFELTAGFQEQLFSRKRTAGLLGFHDVLTLAVAGLREDKSLRRYYKGLFRYIMIDEFQDNNLLQKELLYLLSEEDDVEGEGIPAASALNPGKLFFVGDEKQSIYRFRGADVSVFKQLHSEISEAGGVALELKRNYRSEPALIDFFNDIFREVMRESSEDYQAAFEPLESRDAVIRKPDIRLLYKPHKTDLPDDSLSAEESEAWAIAEYILASVGTLNVADKGDSRKAEFSDFALLFRSGTNQKTYEQVFRAKGIPYNVHSVRSLFQEAPVNDIYNILQLCIYPDDRTASAAFLRSPLINLSDLSLIQFLLSGKRIFEEGQERCCKTETDLLKYRQARSLYERVSSKIDREPLSDIVTDIWFVSGYRYLLLADSSLHGYLEYFDYLNRLAVMHDQNGKSAADFLDYIRENLGEYKKIDELKILSYSTGGVEIMPIHQSKGLEFPVVIVANAGNTGVNDRSGSDPAYISPDYGLSFNLIPESDGAAPVGRCNYFYSHGKEDNRAREEAELRRLLYVALTRAQSHLVVSGCHGSRNKSGRRSMLNIFLDAFGWIDGAEPSEYSEIEPYIDEIENRCWSADGRPGGNKADISAVMKLYASAEPERFDFMPDEFSASGLNALRLQEHSEDSVKDVRQLPGLEPRLEKLLSEKGYEADFGTISHRVIEWCIKNRLWEEMPEAGALSMSLRSFYPRYSDADWELMITAAVSLADGFFRSTIWQKAVKSSGFESELAFTAMRNEDGRNIYVNGVIDLLFEIDDWVQIIDFKTDRRIVPGEYDRQMEIYTDAAAAIYSKPVQCSLFYLRGGEEVEIR